MVNASRRRGWLWIGFLAWLAAQSVGAGALFWGLFPLWLALFWSLQGYPPVWADIVRWYALGAFNAAPILATLLLSPLTIIAALLISRRGNRRHRMVLSAFMYALLTPPLAYALLLTYAQMWQYRALDAMIPTLARAYLMLAPASALVGALLGGLPPPVAELSTRLSASK